MPITKRCLSRHPTICGMSFNADRSSFFVNINSLRKNSRETNATDTYGRNLALFCTYSQRRFDLIHVLPFLHPSLSCYVLLYQSYKPLPHYIGPHLRKTPFFRWTVNCCIERNKTPIHAHWVSNGALSGTKFHVPTIVFFVFILRSILNHTFSVRISNDQYSR